LEKYTFAGREIAAPIGALVMIESTQRPFRAGMWQLVCWFERVASQGNHTQKLMLAVIN
jgi:hypothetical protein